MAVNIKPPVEYDRFPIPKRLRIMEKLVALLERINPGSVYLDVGGVEKSFPIDMRGKVFIGRTTISVDEAEDAMSLLENPRPFDGSDVGWDKTLRIGDWLLLLQGWPRDDIKNPSAPAYKLAAMAEMQMSRVVQLDSKGDPMYPDDYLLGTDPDGGPEIESLSIGQSVVRPPADANSRLAMFFIPLTIRLISDPSTPFN